MQMKCEDCRFWDQDNKISSLGVCRRHAPRASIGESVRGEKATDAIWPRTTGDQWCGEWIAKIEIEKEE